MCSAYSPILQGIKFYQPIQWAFTIVITFKESFSPRKKKKAKILHSASHPTTTMYFHMTYLYSYFVGELLFDLHLLKERNCHCNFTFLNSPSCKTGVKNLLSISGLESGIAVIQTVYFTVLCSNLSNLEKEYPVLFWIFSLRHQSRFLTRAPQLPLPSYSICIRAAGSTTNPYISSWQLRRKLWKYMKNSSSAYTLK